MGIIHPHAALAVCEPTDKHIVIGILSSNTKSNIETACSPIHSLSIVEDLAKSHRYAELDGKKIEIFSAEHIKVLSDAKNFERSLESL